MHVFDEYLRDDEFGGSVKKNVVPPTLKPSSEANINNKIMANTFSLEGKTCPRGQESIQSFLEGIK